MSTLSTEVLELTVDWGKRDYCRAQGGKLNTILDMGSLHLNDFVNENEETKQYPLELCIGEHSQLIQLRHSVDPDLMYRNYWYRSGTNEMMREHLNRLAYSAMRFTQIKQDDVILDIGCNDGTLLKTFMYGQYQLVGFDPSNIVPDVPNMTFINDYFNIDTYIENVDRKAKVIYSVAMFYDLDYPVSFARDVAEILDDEGVWVLEVNYALKMLESANYGEICHEHLCYYTVNSLNFVLEQAGLVINDVSMNNANGGSIRLFIRRPIGNINNSRVFDVMRRENSVFNQLLDPFPDRVKESAQNLQDTIYSLSQDQLVMGYGASTKGNTILQYAQINSDILPAIADRNPDKVGLYTVGTRIPIISEDEMREAHPNYLLALPFFFIPKFLHREREFIAKGGQFIVPVPEVELVS